LINCSNPANPGSTGFEQCRAVDTQFLAIVKCKSSNFFI
jgi:hypothetical protein